MKNKTDTKYKIIGIISELILSNELFSKNTDIENFLKDIFGMELKAYLFKSRTLIVARVTRVIVSMDKEETLYKKRLYKFIELKIEELRGGDVKKIRNDFDRWM